MPKLIVNHPEKGAVSYPLVGDRITVGRRADNTIQINHGTVSGHHAELVLLNGHYILRDLESTNHCFMNGNLVAEVDLQISCKLMFGTVECEFQMEPPVAALASTELDHLRKTLGLLREQNEDLVVKLADQQKQIDILGSARLLTPATGADLDALRKQVKTLTAERDRLMRENENLKTEVDRLSATVALHGETGTLKSTVRVMVPEAGNSTAPLTVLPDGAAVPAAPTARAVQPRDAA